jgi:B12-binding domain/radical SAM domain protein
VPTNKLVFVARAAYGARNAFAFIASALRRSGLLGKRVDLVFVDENPLGVARELRERGREAVVLYGLSSPVFLELMDEVVSVAREFPVVVGGPHAEGAYWQLLRLGVYAAVVGDGENAVIGLAEHFLGERGLEAVPNIAFRDGNGFRVTRIELVELDDYEPFSRDYGLYPPIEIMRGCFYRCKFCQVPWLFKARVRFRSVGSTVSAARSYVEAGKRLIRFVAPIGLAYMSHRPGEPNVEAIEALLRGVRSVGGKPFLGTFPSETRPEYVNPDVLQVLRRFAENKRLAIGLQSGSNKVLERSMRGHTVEDAMEAIRLAARHGFQPVVDLLFGLPGEEEEDVEKTVEIMWELARIQAKMRLHAFIPLPGTPFARERPKPVHPRYKEAALRLTGKGLIEGDWEWQEKIAPAIYCLTAIDPVPSKEPKPSPRDKKYCEKYWNQWSQTLSPYKEVLQAVDR